ncbi:MAG: metallophosphoesterase [Candidatus Nanopelagicales bacterium]|nr:metallophosphoesterase [Candidatus Nanopelagicales bacterium]
MSTAGPAALGLGSAALLYSVAETELFVLRRVTVPCLPAGRGPLRILHISDLHLAPGGRREREWVSALVDTEPDLVVATGDFLAHPDSVPLVLSALGSLLALPGAFVFGSHDYYRPVLKNPVRYLIGPSRLEQRREPDLPWRELARSLTQSGWKDLSNARAGLTVGGLRIDLRGVDDPHIDRDDYSQVAGPFDADADLRLGLTHAPYRRVIEAMSDDGADLILAGHTHGGQLRVPGWGALVSNCDLPPKLARGLSRHGGSRLHVSAGLGTSPYAPIRFACRPEASLLTLTSAPLGR